MATIAKSSNVRSRRDFSRSLRVFQDSGVTIRESSSENDENNNDDDDDDEISQRCSIEGPRFVAHGPFYFRLSVAALPDVSRVATVISSDFTDSSEKELTDRRNSFLSSLWEDATMPRVRDMVDSGFVYTGAYDGTYCFMCEVMIHGWSANDDPFVRHVVNSPGCGFAFRAYLERSLRRFSDFDKSSSSSSSSRLALDRKSVGVQTITTLETISNEESTRTRKQQGGDVFLTDEPPIYLRHDLPMERAKNERYHGIDERFRSFLRCSDLRSLPSPLGLVNSGFYYVGPNDELRCVSCYRTFVNWSPFDSPWQVHAKLSPNCPFVTNDSRVFGLGSRDASTTTTTTTTSMMFPKDPKAIFPNEKTTNCYVWNTTDVATAMNTRVENWRVDSFLPWAKEFAKAGFFMVQSGVIECYACGGHLTNPYELFAERWSPEEVHALWFPKCPLVRHP